MMNFLLGALCVIIFLAGLFLALPILMLAIPGIGLILAVWLIFRWLDKAAAEMDHKHNDTNRR